jgi:hypothetical protein
MAVRRLIFRVHALRRMFERRISVDDIRVALENGEIIEDYPDDVPYPSGLTLGWVAGRPLHIVAAEVTNTGETIIITVYEPDPKLWESNFKRRKM